MAHPHNWTKVGNHAWKCLVLFLFALRDFICRMMLERMIRYVRKCDCKSFIKSLWRLNSNNHNNALTFLPLDVTSHSRIIVSWEPEGRYQCSMMFRWEWEGRYRCTKSMERAPFWFLIQHLWTELYSALPADVRGCSSVEARGGGGGVLPPPPTPHTHNTHTQHAYLSLFCLSARKWHPPPFCACYSCPQHKA